MKYSIIKIILIIAERVNKIVAVYFTNLIMLVLYYRLFSIYYFYDYFSIKENTSSF